MVAELARGVCFTPFIFSRRPKIQYRLRTPGVNDRTTQPRQDDERVGFFAALAGDGRPLLSLTGLALVGSGLFALFLSATGHFLPHDEQFLGMTAKELCSLHGCRIVHFMYHDRASFGGALVAVGTLYLWLAQFPLRRREAWAWWTLLLSGAAGFASFLAYLGYGYLDTWHGAATLVLLPCFALGMFLTYREIESPKGIRSLLRPSRPLGFSTRSDAGRSFLLATAVIITIAGAVILTVGMTSVFVPQDLKFLGVDPAELHRINPRLVPLIAHDRAGFGGGLCCVGLTVFACVWCGTPSRSLWQALALSGTIGFGTAIGVHPLIGYNDAVHIGPAVAGGLLFWVGLVLCGTGGRPARPLPEALTANQQT
jgi:MFS family permease